MKLYVKIVACTAVLISLLVASSETAVADKNLVGVWKSKETKLTFTTDPNREPVVVKNPRPSIFIFTQKHFSWVEVHGDPAPEVEKDSTPKKSEKFKFDKCCMISFVIRSILISA